MQRFQDEDEASSSYQIPETLTQSNSEVQMLNVVEEQTTETDQVELTVSDEEEEEDADTGCEVIDEEDE